jgi:predicted DNA-binding transcriptional regulator AlpA
LKVSTHATLPAALRDFHALPDDALVSQPVVQGLFDISGATAWRWVKSGTLPSPVKIGPNSTRWHVGTLRRVLAERVGG